MKCAWWESSKGYCGVEIDNASPGAKYQRCGKHMCHPDCGLGPCKYAPVIAPDHAPVVAPTPPSGFVKHDSAKLRLDLLPVAALAQIARVFHFGARKYADENYLLGTNWRRYIRAMFTHSTLFAAGEDCDPETGESHLAHVACNAIMLLELIRVGTGTDDRVKVEPSQLTQLFRTFGD